MDAPHTDLTPADVLSQNDVERLLAQVAEQETTTVVHKATGETDTKKHEQIQPYDFRQPSFLTATELRRLRLRHEDFISSLAARLSIFLRLEFGLQMSKLQTLSYQKFIDSMANPTVLTLFKLEPLRGVCLLDVHPRLGMTIVDRLLGGPAHSVNASRDMTDIETSLLDRAVQVILNEWCSQWRAMRELRPVLLGHETNGRFLQTSSPDAMMLALGMEARLGDCVEQIQIGFPLFTLEPLLRQMAEGMREHDTATPATPAATPKWNPELDDIPITVTAEWEGLELTARELGNLQPGDVLMLDSRCANEVQVRLGGATKFTGRPGTRNQAWAVELTRRVSSSNSTP